MRTLIICFVCLSSTLNVRGQSRSFLNKATEAVKVKDAISEIEEISAEPESYEIISKGSGELELLFLSFLKNKSRSNPDELQKSSTLNTLADIATDAWKGSHYSSAKKWKKLSKHFRRAASVSTSPFNIMREVSFRIKLVDNHGRRFFYDKKGPEGELNLYSGTVRDKKKAEEEEGTEELTPLSFHDETKLIKEFERQVKRKGLISDLRKGHFAYVGLSVELDERTLGRSRIPTARVVVLFGARRMRRVKVK